MVGDKRYRCRSVVCSRDSKPGRNIEKRKEDIHACAVPKLERKPVAVGEANNSNGSASHDCSVVSELRKINTIRKEETFKIIQAIKQIDSAESLKANRSSAKHHLAISIPTPAFHAPLA
jgi:hypothetical protein